MSWSYYFLHTLVCLLLASTASCTPRRPQGNTQARAGNAAPPQIHGNVPVASTGPETIVAAAGPGVTSGGRTSEGSPGTGPGAPRGRLGHWRFNTPDLKGERGQLPLLATNVRTVASFDGNAMGWNPTNGAAILKYRVTESDGSTNLDCRHGSIRLMYRPDWSSPNAGGRGPGAWIRLLELGAYTRDASIGWLALSIDPAGSNLWFTLQDNKGHTSSNAANLRPGQSSWNIFFRSNTWTQLIVTYGDEHVQIWQDGSLFTDAAAASLPVPPAPVQALGFSLGSSTNGTLPALGSIDEFETMNYPMGRTEAQYTFNRSLSASVDATPPSIRLQWSRHPSFTTVLSRRLWGQTNWSALATNAGWQYVDSRVAPAQRYEYTLSVVGNSDYTGYLAAGIRLPPVERRGKILLLVDETLARSLPAELTRLTLDLVGDGWTVVRRDVARHDDTHWAKNTNNIARIKAGIVADYRADPAETKAIFIVGHVAIPYSGYLAPDGHHPRWWPSDAYYADVDGTWTDGSSAAGRLAGDGIFDQDAAPSRLELAVGRVDFARLAGFTKARSPYSKQELDLLKQYLNKTHRYRHREVVLPDRAIVGTFFNNPEDDYVSGNAAVNVPRWFGGQPGTLLEGDLFRDPRPCLWGFFGGYGSTVAINILPGYGMQRHGSDLADPANEPPVGFFTLHGSYFCEWNTEDNFLRSVLATPNYGFASVWNRGSSLLFERLALGDTLGDGFLRMQNEGVTSPQLTLALMGDPTLRLRVMAPPRELKAEAKGGNVMLTWKLPAVPGVGYHVFRSTGGLGGTFDRLTTSPVLETRFTDTGAPKATKTYQVRTVSLEVTGSGSYTNLSQAAFAVVN